jgi:hypothetical protein
MEGVTDQPSGQLSEQPQRSPPPSPSFQSEPAKVPAVFLAMQQEKLAAEKAAQVPFHSFSVATAAAHTGTVTADSVGWRRLVPRIGLIGFALNHVDLLSGEGSSRCGRGYARCGGSCQATRANEALHQESRLCGLEVEQADLRRR